MKIGFKNPEWEKHFNNTFDIYVEMVKCSNPGTREFNFASQMMRNQLDFMVYNCEPCAVDVLKEVSYD